MKQKLMLHVILAFSLAFFAIACNNEEKNDKEETVEDTKEKSSSMPTYDPAMDPLKVEAQFSKLLADTLNVKLYEVTLNPGDSAAMHTHPDYILYVLQGGTLKIYPKDGEPQVNELPTGMGVIFPTGSHSGKNIGTTPVKLLVTDIYRPRD